MIRYNDDYLYEIYNDGYDIFRDGEDKPYVTQRDPYGKIYLPNGTYEENCLAQLKDMVDPSPSPVPPAPPVPTEVEKLRADVDYIALMSDYVLPSEEEE